MEVTISLREPSGKVEGDEAKIKIHSTNGGA